MFSRKLIRIMLPGLLCALTLAAVGAGSLLTWKGYHSVYAQPFIYAMPPAPTFRAARKIFPFSIIPGGVYDPKELAQSLQLDPSLQEHYRDIRIENLVAVRTQAPMQAYVSFRYAGNICWTAKAQTIPRGELILTDGQHMIRSRCGNRIQRTRPPSVVSSLAITEQMQDLIFDAPLPSISNPSLQPVLSSGVLVAELWPEPGNNSALAPEPGTMILCASGFLLIFLRTISQR